MFINKIITLLLILFQMACSSLPPLNEAIYHGNTDEALKLIEEGDDLETVSKYGATPMHFAAANNRLAIITALSKAGANIEARDVDNQTPFLYACYHGKKEAAKLLLELGANKEATDKSGANCIYIAATNKQPEMIKLMIENGLNPNLAKNNRYTALHAAAEKGDIESAELLLKNGGNANSLGPSDQTPLDLAIKSNNSDIAIILLQGGAKPHVINSKSFNFSSAIAAQEFLLAASYNEEIGEFNNSIDEYKTAAEQFNKLARELDEKSSQLLKSAFTGLAIDALFGVALGACSTCYSASYYRPDFLTNMLNRGDVKDMAEYSRERSKFCNAKISELEKKVKIESLESDDISILRP